MIVQENWVNYYKSKICFCLTFLYNSLTTFGTLLIVRSDISILVTCLLNMLFHFIWRDVGSCYRTLACSATVQRIQTAGKAGVCIRDPTGLTFHHRLPFQFHLSSFILFPSLFSSRTINYS